jgi:hypothetical protein
MPAALDHAGGEADSEIAEHDRQAVASACGEGG